MASSLLHYASLLHLPHASTSLSMLPAFRPLIFLTPSPLPSSSPSPSPYSLSSVRLDTVCLAAKTEQGNNNRASEDEGKGGAQFDISRLEKYTEKVPDEVLQVHAVVDGEEDQVLIFKGFSSSLMRAIAFDPSELVLPASASIWAIDRIRGPYNPARVLLIKGGRGLSWQ